MVDKDGVKQEKGKAYELIGYNESGEERVVKFIKRGTAEDYYEPETYITVDVSKTLELGVDLVDKEYIPEKALEIIDELGTKK